MQWLISQVWIMLALASLFGGFIGVSIRGLLAARTIRRAGVERDVVKTELEQSRAEVDALYAAQKKRQDQMQAAELQNGDASAQLADREGRIQQLSSDLAEANAVAEALKLRIAEQAAQASQLASQVATMPVIPAVSEAQADAAPAGPAAPAGDEAVFRQLEERNTWLEQRVADLEAMQRAAVDAAPAIVTAARAEPQAPEPQAPEPQAPEPQAEVQVAADPGIEKTKWQNTYLRQRVAALETEILTRAAATFAPAASADAPPPADVAPLVETGVVDEELARLRWRNRYLEGRLAYYEQAADEAVTAAGDTVEASQGGEIDLGGAIVSNDDEPSPQPPETIDETVPALGTAGQTLEAVDEAAAPLVERSLVPEAFDEVEDEDEARLEALDFDQDDDIGTEAAVPAFDDELVGGIAGDDAGPVEVLHEDVNAVLNGTQTGLEDMEEPLDEPIEHPSDSVLKALGGAMIDHIQPVAVPEPDEDERDDLTQIDGIGPRIADLLNELGIWTFEQIAEWTPENVAWVDRHMSFDGRIQRQGWVEQAEDLVLGDAD